MGCKTRCKDFSVQYKIYRIPVVFFLFKRKKDESARLKGRNTVKTHKREKILSWCTPVFRISRTD